MEDWVYPGLSHLEVTKDKGDGEGTVISVRLADGDYVIVENGDPQVKCENPAEIAPFVNSFVFSRCIENTGYLVGFHAGAVSDGDSALVLPGKAGSGKTTLTAALVRAGFQYLTDDLLLMRGKDLLVEGVPFSFCVKEGGVSVLSPYFPVLQSLRTHTRADGKRVRYLPPPKSAFDVRSAKPARARWVVFPRYEAGAETRLDAIDRGSALSRLIDSCTLSRPLSQEQVGAFVDWIRGVTCYHLTMGSLDESVEILRRLWQQPRQD